VQPIADARVLPIDGDPAELVTARESIRLAFVAALQHLPPRQRAVLILCEVLRWQAAEVADLLETSVASVNSALQRARAGMAEVRSDSLDPVVTPEHEELLARYVDAFERYDMDALVQLLRDDVVLSMPPFPTWLRGADQLVAFFMGTGIGCRGSKVIATRANGTAAFGSYKPAGEGRWEPWSLQVVEVRDGRISGHHNFLFPELFEQFGMPPYLEA
jgi:RNA polymerase sigma-70 factor (ECF subfamily)